MNDSWTGQSGLESDLRMSMYPMREPAYFYPHLGAFPWGVPRWFSDSATSLFLVPREQMILGSET